MGALEGPDSPTGGEFTLVEGENMGAHVFIVNKETFPIAQYRCVAAVVREKKKGCKLREKTIADVLADVSCIRKGDRIFFYEIQKGFHGIYEAISSSFVDEDEVEGKNGKYLFGSENNPLISLSQLLAAIWI
ncbi:MAG: hypothetical protein ACUVXI_16875 [bacterium]